ncbi:MAG: hypothetical protein M1820_006604 [Bogoriella megaspora]|nr:MAG: hypothetical protein M1820_006604 [Bogoriella megaspora]
MTRLENVVLARCVLQANALAAVLLKQTHAPVDECRQVNAAARRLVVWALRVPLRPISRARSSRWWTEHDAKANYTTGLD